MRDDNCQVRITMCFCQRKPEVLKDMGAFIGGLRWLRSPAKHDGPRDDGYLYTIS